MPSLSTFGQVPEQASLIWCVARLLAPLRGPYDPNTTPNPNRLTGLRLDHLLARPEPIMYAVAIKLRSSVLF